MKITPLATGTGVPAQSENVNTKSISPDARARAIAAASGQEVKPKEAVVNGQIDKPSIQTIKMKTQQSTNRHELLEEPFEAVTDESPTNDATEPVETVEETKPLSPQFAALAKAKRALQVKERELALREDALKNQTGQPKTDEFISKAELQANPLKIFESGLSYDQLTEAILNSQSGVNPEINTLKAELKSLKEDISKQLSDRDQLAEQQVLAEMKRETLAITSEGEKYEAIREAKAEQKVVDLIHKVFKEGWTEKGYEPGFVMDLDDAAELIENQLIEDAMPYAKLKKVQSRLIPQVVEQAAQIPAPQQQKPNTKIMRTLTNRDNASAQNTDRRSRAIAAMLGTLNKG